MKNQNDLIFSIVFGVLAIIAVGIAYGTQETPPVPSAPPSVVVTDATPPATAVVYGNALPAGATTGGTAGGLGGSGMGMMPPGMGAPPSSGSFRAAPTGSVPSGSGGPMPVGR